MILMSITNYLLIRMVDQANINMRKFGSFARNFHIGFDSEYELIINTRSVSNKTSDDRIVWLVIVIELEVKNEHFRLCFMSQNRAVVENKRVLPVLVPSPGTWSPPPSWQRITRDRNTFKQ